MQLELLYGLPLVYLKLVGDEIWNMQMLKIILVLWPLN